MNKRPLFRFRWNKTETSVLCKASDINWHTELNQQLITNLYEFSVHNPSKNSSSHYQLFRPNLFDKVIFLRQIIPVLCYLHSNKTFKIRGMKSIVDNDGFLSYELTNVSQEEINLKMGESYIRLNSPENDDGKSKIIAIEWQSLNIWEIRIMYFVHVFLFNKLRKLQSWYDNHDKLIQFIIQFLILTIALITLMVTILK